jgi:hypothetical protein
VRWFFSTKGRTVCRNREWCVRACVTVRCWCLSAG